MSDFLEAARAELARLHGEILAREQVADHLRELLRLYADAGTDAPPADTPERDEPEPAPAAPDNPVIPPPPTLTEQLASVLAAAGQPVSLDYTVNALSALGGGTWPRAIVAARLAQSRRFRRSEPGLYALVE